MSWFYKIWWGVAAAVFVGLIVYWALRISPQAALAMAVFVIGATVVLGTIFKRRAGGR